MPSDRPSDDNSGRALSALKRMIQAGEVGADGRLPTERDLAERLSVGRRAVRRALAALEAEGLIWRHQGKGTFLGQAPEPASLLAAGIAPEVDAGEILEARLSLEPRLAALCAGRATREDVRRMRDFADRAAAASDPDAAELWDGALHRAIARAAGNRLLLAGFALLDEVRNDDHWRAMRERARSAESFDLYDRQHHRLIDAIAAGDAEAAAAAMRAHLEAVAHRFRHAASRQEAPHDA